MARVEGFCALRELSFPPFELYFLTTPKLDPIRSRRGLFLFNFKRIIIIPYCESHFPEWPMNDAVKARELDNDFLQRCSRASDREGNWILAASNKVSKALCSFVKIVFS